MWKMKVVKPVILAETVMKPPVMKSRISIPRMISFLKMFSLREISGWRRHKYTSSMLESRLRHSG